MGKRIFSIQIAATVPLGEAADTVHNALAAWTPEEDVEVVGAELTTQVHEVDIAVDGFAGLRTQLSQFGAMGNYSVIAEGYACVSSYIVVAAAQSAQYENSHAVVMFPEGHSIPVSEGTSLYLNAYKVGLCATKVVNCHIYAQIFYTKKGK